MGNGSVAGTMFDGQEPTADLIVDNNGNLYGTTSAGGTYNRGTVFELLRPTELGAPWTEFSGRGPMVKIQMAS